MGSYPQIKRAREAGAYGWSRMFAKDHRLRSEAYEQNYDQIDWSKGKSLGPCDKINRLCLRGKAQVWVFGPERFKND